MQTYNSNYIVFVGLAGKTPIEQARVNMIALTLEDALFRHSSGIINTFDTTKQVNVTHVYSESNVNSNFLYMPSLAIQQGACFRIACLKPVANSLTCPTSG